MGILSSIFQSNNNENKKVSFPWIPLTEGNQLEEIITKSNTKPILIFKHSTRCGISSMVIRNFEREYNLPESKIDLYYLDLLKHRILSNDISLKYNILHQSPQVIVISKEQVIYHDSHHQISVDAIKKVVSV